MAEVYIGSKLPFERFVQEVSALMPASPASVFHEKLNQILSRLRDLNRELLDLNLDAECNAVFQSCIRIHQEARAEESSYETLMQECRVVFLENDQPEASYDSAIQKIMKINRKQAGICQKPLFQSKKPIFAETVCGWMTTGWMRWLCSFPYHKTYSLDEIQFMSFDAFLQMKNDSVSL